MAILMTCVTWTLVCDDHCENHLLINNILKGHSGESLDDFGHSYAFLDTMPKEQCLNDKQDFNKMQTSSP